jgi:histidine ammonia-lyase
VRARVPFTERDREIRLDIEQMNKLVRDGSMMECVAEQLDNFQ